MLGVSAYMSNVSEMHFLKWDFAPVATFTIYLFHFFMVNRFADWLWSPYPETNGMLKVPALSLGIQPASESIAPARSTSAEWHDQLVTRRLDLESQQASCLALERWHRAEILPVLLKDEWEVGKGLETKAGQAKVDPTASNYSSRKKAVSSKLQPVTDSSLFVSS